MEADVLPLCGANLFLGESLVRYNTLCSHKLIVDLCMMMQELIDRMVSSHIHSRKAGSIEQAAGTITRLSQAYLAYTDSKRP